MAKKKRGRKMPVWKKWLRAGVKIIGVATGTLVATAPVHRGLRRLAGGNFEGAADAIAFDTTGLSTANPDFPIDISKVVRTGLLVGLGVGLMKLFSYLSRRI